MPKCNTKSISNNKDCIKCENNKNNEEEFDDLAVLSDSLDEIHVIPSFQNSCLRKIYTFLQIHYTSKKNNMSETHITF